MPVLPLDTTRYHWQSQLLAQAPSMPAGQTARCGLITNLPHAASFLQYLRVCSIDTTLAGQSEVAIRYIQP